MKYIGMALGLKLHYEQINKQTVLQAGIITIAFPQVSLEEYK